MLDRPWSKGRPELSLVRRTDSSAEEIRNHNVQRNTRRKCQWWCSRWIHGHPPIIDRHIWVEERSSRHLSSLIRVVCQLLARCERVFDAYDGDYLELIHIGTETFDSPRWVQAWNVGQHRSPVVGAWSNVRVDWIDTSSMNTNEYLYAPCSSTSSDWNQCLLREIEVQESARPSLVCRH